MRFRFKSPWVQQMQSVLRPRSIDPGATRINSAVAGLDIDASWDEAFMRVESYLRAHHFESRVQLTRLTTEILAAARELASRFPDEEPVTLAMRVAQARIGDWLQRALGEGDWADERFRARGRLALLRSELPHRCPQLFLSRDPLPVPVVAELADAHLVASPELRPTTMPPANLEFPLGELAEEKWETFSRSTFTRAAAWRCSSVFSASPGLRRVEP
jgi:hypothetical protein